LVVEEPLLSDAEDFEAAGSALETDSDELDDDSPPEEADSPPDDDSPAEVESLELDSAFFLPSSDFAFSRWRLRVP
jgi:hypothetical protein